MADGELSPQELAELQEELNSDPTASAEYQSILQMKAALQGMRSEAENTDSLWSECRDRFDEIDRTRRVESFVGKYAWGICGVFFLAIAMGGFFNRANIKPVKPADVPSYVAGITPVPVSKNQKQEVLDPVLKQVLGDSFENRPSKMQITAIGGNRIPGRRSTFVQLSDAFGDVAVVALHDLARIEGLYNYEADPSFKCTRFDGVNALFWTREDGVICMALGQRSYDELYQIVHGMCPSQ